MNAKEAIELYYEGKEKKAKMDAEYKAKCKSYDEKFKKIEAYLRAIMAKQGVESLKTEAGTAYISTRSRVSCADKDEFMQFIRKNDFWELLDARPLKSGVEAYVAENNRLPPGLNITREQVVNVRRS